MARNEYEQLLDKEELNAFDAGRILLFDFVDRRRVDGKARESRIDRKALMQHIQQLHRQDALSRRQVECYREAYNFLINFPAMHKGNVYQVLWGLDVMARNAKDLLRADSQLDADRLTPRIVTRKQYKELKAYVVNFRRKKFKAKNVFRDILEYALYNHDRETPLPFTISRAEINANPPEGWTGRKALFFDAVADEHFYPANGVTLTPFDALLDHFFYYSPKCIDLKIALHFPELVDNIVSLMKQSGVNHSPFEEEKWPHVTLGRLLNSPLAFLYRGLDPMPSGGVAVIEDVSDAVAKICIDPHGRYSPPPPAWVRECLAHRIDDLNAEQTQLIEDVDSAYKHAKAECLFMELAEEAMNVKGLRYILPRIEDEIAIAIEKYHAEREALLALYKMRYLSKEMSREMYLEVANLFPEIDLENYTVSKINFQSAYGVCDSTLFMGKHVAALDFLCPKAGTIFVPTNNDD